MLQHKSDTVLLKNNLCPLNSGETLKIAPKDTQRCLFAIGYFEITLTGPLLSPFVVIRMRMDGFATGWSRPGQTGSRPV